MSCGIGGSRAIRSAVRIKTIASHGAGEMAEWLKAHAWKACLLERVTWVRIPLSPPVLYPHKHWGLRIVIKDLPRAAQENRLLVIRNRGAGCSPSPLTVATM